MLIDPPLLPGPALITGFVLTSLTWWRDRGATDHRGLRWGLLGRIPGNALGAASVALLPASDLEVALGAVILMAVTLTATRVRVVPTRPTMLSARVVSGFVTSTAAIGGPPVALVYRRLPGPTVHSTIASLATIGGAVSILFLGLAGELPAREVWFGLALVPALLLGFRLSHRLADVLTAATCARPSSRSAHRPDLPLCSEEHCEAQVKVMIRASTATAPAPRHRTMTGLSSASAMSP